jgi:hypothetical protein
VQAVNNRVHLDMRDLSSHILYQQFCSIQDRTATIDGPRRLYLSLANRRQDWNHLGRDSMSLLGNMRRWITASASSVHFVRAGPRAGKKCKDLGAIVVDLLLASGQKCAWSLSTCGTPTACNDVLKSLVSQALQHGSNSIVAGMLSIFSAISEDHTDDEWIDLLRLVLDNFPESGPAMFLVVETEHANLIKAIQKFTNTASLTAAGKCKVKVLLIVSSSVVEVPPLPPTSLQVNVSSVRQAPPVPAKLRRTHRGDRGGLALDQVLGPMFDADANDQPILTRN